MISGNKEVNNEVQSVTKGDCRRRQGAYYKFYKKNFQLSTKTPC